MTFLFQLVKILWNTRDDRESQFIKILFLYSRTVPLATHALDYITWITTFKSQRYELSKNEIVITFKKV
jgi:hypothetical protein